MADTPYPLPRETRESSINVGNGTAGPYGPSTYKIFDTADVTVWRKEPADKFFRDVTSTSIVTKTTGADLDTFSVSFVSPVPATTKWYHSAKRVSNRQVAVTRAGALDAPQLEKELSKQASAQSELRRDVDRSARVGPGETAPFITPLANGHFLIFRDGNLVDGGEAANVDEALADLAEFRRQFLGSYPSNPATDPNGNPLQRGAIYWNSTVGAFFYWDGSNWQGFPYSSPADGTVTLQKLAAALKAVVSPLGQIVVFVSTGQSNIAIKEPLIWPVPKNLFDWNWNGVDETTVGTAFVPADGTMIGLGISCAAEFARKHPGAAVFHINIGRGDQPIAQWMAGAATPKMFNAVKANVEAALAVLGVDHIDHINWMQGEKDYQLGAAVYTNYQANFETVMARFYAESWCPPSTTVTIVGTSPLYLSGSMGRYFNPILKQCALADPQRRTYADLDKLPAAYWMPPLAIHMTGLGYREAGRLAFIAGERGVGQRLRRSASIIRVKPTTEPQTSNAVMQSDGDLGIFIGDDPCHVKFTVFGETILGAGFKWSLTGGGVSYSIWRSRWIATNIATTPFEEVGQGYPTEKVLTNVAGRFMLEVDFFSNGASVPGMLFFRWAQNAANAAQTLVTAGSSVMKVAAG